MKALLLTVTCYNEYFDEAPDNFYIKVSDELIKRINQTAKLVKESPLYCASFCYSEGCYFKSDVVGLENSEQQIDDNMLEVINLKCEDMEMALVTVYKDHITFSATPKYCDESERCETVAVSLVQLKG